MKKVYFVFAVLILALSLTGCIINEEVQPNEVGIVTRAGEIVKCVPSGLVNDWGYYMDLVRVRKDTQTFDFSNSSVATKDTQIVSVGVTVQVARKGDCDSAKAFLNDWPQLLDDGILQQTVSSTGSEAIKNGVREFNLETLLNDRNALADKIQSALQEDADAYNVTIINVIVNDVDVDAAYIAELSNKALITVQTETALKRQDLVRAEAQTSIMEQQQATLILEEQLKREQAQTDITEEISRRASVAKAAEWEIYLTNEKAFELYRLQLYQGIFTGSKWVFIDDSNDLSTIIDGDEIIPIVK